MQQLFSRDLYENGFIPVDQWVPAPKDILFSHVKGALILPVSQFYGIDNNPNLDCFVLSTKRCYNSDTVRTHMTNYLNYFEKYYDKEHTLLLNFIKIKYLMDYEKDYNTEALFYDLKKYILGPEIHSKLTRMNDDNYLLELSYRNEKNPGLQYNDKHGKIFMEISIFMNMIIPFLTHFIFVKKIVEIQDFLLRGFDLIISLYEEADIYSKLFETSISNVTKSRNQHSVLWDMQNIRGMNDATHSIGIVNNVILQIMPKYTYNKNLVHFNYNAIQKSISCQVIEIGYEYDFVSLSSSRRDEDSNSEFDRFESRLIKQDESLYLQNKVNAQSSMERIERMFGPFDRDEIEFYKKSLSDDGMLSINPFQKDLIFNLFYKYFGDPTSIKAINIDQYVKLILAAKKILEINGMVILPYVISSKITRLVTRKNVNKKEFTKLESSPYYANIKAKYRNEKIEKYILSTIAAILSSEFAIIDYNDKNINGRRVEVDTVPEFLIEEVLLYILLI